MNLFQSGAHKTSGGSASAHGGPTSLQTIARPSIDPDTASLDPATADVIAPDSTPITSAPSGSTAVTVNATVAPVTLPQPEAVAMMLASMLALINVET